MTALLRATKLTKRYGTTVALDSVDFEVHDGVTGLLGSNGAGKSTALRLFLGLIQPDAGSAEFVGAGTNDRVAARERIGYMPEHDCLPGHVSAAEFLTHIAQVSGLPPHEARTRATDVLRHVGLGEERYRPMGGYSTGMKQRAKLAQAFVHDPVIVLLDEPTAGLDPSGRQEMLDLIIRTGREFGISILLSSHLMGDVERTCDRVIVLEGGRLSREGEVARLVEDTETLIIQVQDGLNELLSAMKKRNVEAHVEAGSVVVDRATGEDMDRIRDAIAESGALLYRLAPRRHTLAEVFQAPAETGVESQAGQLKAAP
ncbi:MAG: ABC transporter ATP-binding protein [Chloroflexi bacterium]|nr:ABC transporter ATP-binding protein [Chloroflexota bacterium]